MCSTTARWCTAAAPPSLPATRPASAPWPAPAPRSGRSRRKCVYSRAAFERRGTVARVGPLIPAPAGIQQGKKWPQAPAADLRCRRERRGTNMATRSSHQILSYTDGIAAGTSDIVLLAARLLLAAVFLMTVWGGGPSAAYLTSINYIAPAFM